MHPIIVKNRNFHIKYKQLLDQKADAGIIGVYLKFQSVPGQNKTENSRWKRFSLNCAKYRNSCFLLLFPALAFVNVPNSITLLLLPCS